MSEFSRQTPEYVPSTPEREAFMLLIEAHTDPVATPKYAIDLIEGTTREREYNLHGIQLVNFASIKLYTSERINVDEDDRRPVGWREKTSRIEFVPSEGEELFSIVYSIDSSNAESVHVANSGGDNVPYSDKELASTTQAFKELIAANKLTQT